jgi:hypothetical protein
MAKPLLERQVSLIAHLTSGAAIFGGTGNSTADFEGIDRTLLRVEARFSYAKRMGKITAVLPRTFELLGKSAEKYARAFVESCPPTTLSRLENACQFHRFLVSWWMREAPDPPWIRDVTALEIARAEVDADPRHQPCDHTISADRARRRRSDPCGRPLAGPCDARAGRPRGPPLQSATPMPKGRIRRCPHVILLRCAYDVRSIFEASSPALSRIEERVGEGAVPVKRDTRLVVNSPPGADGPEVCEIIPPIFELLSALSDWTDPTELPADPQFADLVTDLASRGLIEVRP